MSAAIDIIPTYYSPQPRQSDKAGNACDLADDLKTIHGVESVEVCDYTRRAGFHGHPPDPVITVAIINATGVTLTAIINGVFAVIQNNRKKKDNANVVINIHNNRFLIEADDDSLIKEKMVKILEEQSKGKF